MPTPLSVITSPIRLKTEEGSRRVLVEPADENRFVLVVQKVIEACRLYHEGVVKAREFEEEVLTRLQAWVSGHATRLSAAYLTLRDQGLLFVACCSGPYDFGLEDSLTDLDISVARNHPDFTLDVLEAPALDGSAVAAFVGEPSLMFDCEQH